MGEQPQVGAGRTVLVVDHNPDAAESLAVLLRLHGHVVETALTGPDALRAVGICNPDVVCLSIALPGLDGYEVARRLRAAGRPVRLVAMTGFGRPEDVHKSLVAGFDHHLIKPVDPDIILALLRAEPTPS